MISPIISQLALGFVTAPLVYGFACILNDRYKNGAVDFGVSFNGFKHIVPLFVLYLIQQVTLYGAVIGLGLLLLGPELIDIFSEMMAQSQSGAFMTNSDLGASYGKEIGDLIGNNIVGLLIILAVSLVISAMFTFPPYYILFKKESIGGALSKGVKLGLNNIPVMVGIFITVFLIAMIATVIFSLLSMFLVFIVMLVIFPLIMSIIYAMFRSAEPDDSEGAAEGMEEILDVE